MFVGGYWSQREESKESAAARVAGFLAGLSSHGAEFCTWYRKGKGRAAARRVVLGLEPTSISGEFKQNHRDTDRKPIPELGYYFAAWNGEKVSFSAALGGWSPHVRNSVVLCLGGDNDLGEDTYRAILELLVRLFEPEHGVVTSNEYLDRIGVVNPWDAGMFTYVHGGIVEQHPFY